MSEPVGAAQVLRVGELATLAGLTVRTLHHYDDVGILVPDRTPAGHRTYRREHLERLYRISVLRRFGTPLEEIGRALDDPSWTLTSALRDHLVSIEDEVLRTERLLHRLGDLPLASSRAAGWDPSADQGPGPDRDGEEDRTDTADEIAVCQRLLAVLQDTAVARTEPLRRIAVLVYEDLERAHDHLVRVFALEPGPIHRADDGTVQQAEVRTADGLILLHPVAPRWRLASPSALGAATGMLVVTVQDVDAHYAAVLSRGGTVTYPPTNQPYGVREFGALGPEEEPWSFWTPLPDTQ